MLQRQLENSIDQGLALKTHLNCDRYCMPQTGSLEPNCTSETEETIFSGIGKPGRFLEIFAQKQCHS